MSERKFSETLQKRDQELKKVITSILESRTVETLFQPIVDLADSNIIGYEALVRGPKGSPLHLPENLFATANKFGITGQVEDICREAVLKSFAASGITTKIFVNIDAGAEVNQLVPEYIRNTLLPELGHDHKDVVLEVKHQLADSSIKQCTQDFFQHGFSFAIDGTGMGYANLESLFGILPSYIKIDRFFVHNVNAKRHKALMISSIVEYAHSVGAKVIAQGVETEAELVAVFQLGVDYVQGYLLGKPTSTPEQITTEVCELLKTCKLRYPGKKKSESAVKVTIGDIIEYCPTIAAKTLVKEAEAIINSEKVEGIVVLNNRRPVGLVMKNKLYFRLGTRYGVSLYQTRPAELIMDQQPLIVDVGVTLDQASNLAMSRENDNKYDFIIVTDEEEYRGIVTIMNLLNKVTELQVKYAQQANPLTGLPGNFIIDHHLKALVESIEPFAVLYIDIDNFKAFNDKFGFEQGDQALLLTTSILQSRIAELCDSDAFLGHIGGDDFFVIIKPDEVDILCINLIRSFDEEIKRLYSQEDLERGFIELINRRGQWESFSIMTISIGVAQSRSRTFSNYLEIVSLATEMKRRAKAIEGSTYVVDQRKNA